MFTRHSFLVLLLAALLVAPVLSGCRPGTSQSTDTVEIEVWHRWSGANAEILAQMEQDFEAKNPNVVIKDAPQVGEYMDMLQKMIANMAAGQDPPDILIGGYNLMNYISEELQPIPIDELGGSEAQEVFDRFEPAVLEIGNVGGKQIGLPFAISNIVMYYNPEIFEAAGLDPNAPPETWEEVFELGKIIKEKTGKYPVAIQKMDNWADQALIFSNGGKLLSDDGKCVAFDNDGAVGAYEMWARLHQEGLSPKGIDEDLHASFAAGGLAMYGTTIMKLRSLRENAKFELGVAPFPAFEGKTKALPAGGAAIMVFSKDPQKQKAAWELAKYLTSEEGMKSWTKTGYLCIIKADVPIEKGQEVAYAQVPNAVKWLSWPGGSKGLEIDRTFLDTRTKIIYGEIGAREGLERAAASSNELLGCK
jgi:multiple sugar transport system substrate-binding protein